MGRARCARVPSVERSDWVSFVNGDKANAVTCWFALLSHLSCKLLQMVRNDVCCHAEFEYSFEGHEFLNSPVAKILQRDRMTCMVEER